MSRETVQFVEMVRQAVGQMKAFEGGGAPLPPTAERSGTCGASGKPWRWCTWCRGEHEFEVRLSGDWETQTCTGCGKGETYRVR